MTDYSELEDAVRRVRQDMDDVADVWRHCRIAMVADDEIVGFPSFNKAHLRSLLIALSQSKAREERMRGALREIETLEVRPFAGGVDWEAVKVCEECIRYTGHPIQQGICDTHRRPIWDRQKHDGHEEKALGYRMKSIARDALALKETNQ